MQCGNLPPNFDTYARFFNCYMSFLLPTMDYVFMSKINETTVFTSEK